MITNPKRESANVIQYFLVEDEDEPPDILKPETGQAVMPGTAPVTAVAEGRPGVTDPARSRRLSGMEGTPGYGTYRMARIR